MDRRTVSADVTGQELDEGSALISRRKLLVSAAAAAAGAAVGPTALAASAKAASSAVKRGGVLRVAMIAEPPSASIATAWQWSGVIGLARLEQVFEKLTDYGPTPGSIIPVLATSWEPKGSAKVWRIKLRRGVTWHNGKSFTADDVVYSLQQILNPKVAATPSSVLASVLAPSGIKKISDSEIELHLKVPYATIETVLASDMYIVQHGWKSSASEPYMPGTGPFMYKSFSPGSLTVFTRNPNYWESGKPYVDEMHFLSVADESARISALLSGQVDIAHSISPPTVQSLHGHSGVVPLISKDAHWIPFVMATKRPPFTDVRVRQAFRLMVDRPAMVKKALSGYGFVGNDLICPFDPLYAKSLPQREQDIDKAKFLLKQAGMEGLKTTLETSAITAGAVEAATLFASQAKQAGVQITLHTTTPDDYFASTGPWQNTPFFQDENGDYNIDQGYALFFTTQGPYNETQWSVPGWDAKIAQANATLDIKKRRELWYEIQKTQYLDGGMMIPFFADFLDAYSTKVHGLKPNWKRELGWFQFKNVWMTA